MPMLSTPPALASAEKPHRCTSCDRPLRWLYAPGRFDYLVLTVDEHFRCKERCSFTWRMVGEMVEVTRVDGVTMLAVDYDLGGDLAMGARFTLVSGPAVYWSVEEQLAEDMARLDANLHGCPTRTVWRKEAA